jgi:hypothetical protein
MNPRLRLAAAAILGFAMAFASGCGGGVSKVRISGQLSKKGQPLKVPKETRVLLQFAPDEKTPTQTYSAKFTHETGEYEIELPAGRYSIQCRMMDENGAKIPTGKSTVRDLSNTMVLNIDVAPDQ